MNNNVGGQIASTITAILPWLAVFVGLTLVLAIILGTIFRIINYTRNLKQNSVLLEVTPPAFRDKVPDATSQLFSVLHGLHKNRSIMQKLFRQSSSFSLEIVSTRKGGIRYLIRTGKDNVGLIKQAVAAYVADAKVKEVPEYLDSGQITAVQVYKQAVHFAHSIDTSKSISEHDPVAYLTNAMTKLQDDELISFQLVVTPAVISQASSIDRKIRQGKDAGSSLQKRFTLSSIFSYLFLLLKLPFIIVTGMIYGILYNDLPDNMKSSNKAQKYYNNESLPPAEQELVDKLHDKLNQDLFYTEIRSLIISSDKTRRKERAKAIANSLATFSTPKFQRIKPRVNFFGTIGNKMRGYAYRNRMPSLLHANSNILGSAELAAIFHFPHSQSARTENVSKSLSKTLPAPISLKDTANELDIVLGRNIHQGQETAFGLTEAERERHIYIIGGTGNGKTTMLQYGLFQDIHNGKGVAVIDPHGDLATTLLKYIPKKSIKDVIYFDPDDIDYPMSMNLLELPDNLTGSALEREKDRVTESVISVLRKIFSDDDTGGHRIEYVLRNAIQTALTTEDPTIFTIFELLTNDNYRKKITNNLPAGTLKNFWQNELGKAGAMQRVKMSQGVTSKIGRFEFSPATKRVMGQPKSTLDFDDILASGKILICNFSKGNLGEDTSALFGTAILAKLQVAALRRSKIEQSERRPYYLYVDEFQNFATMPFVQMLSEARKYKLFLTMAEQSTAQQDEQRLVNIILANVGTVVSFRTGSPIDESLVLPLFKPFVEEGEIANLPSFNFYARVSAIKSQEPLSGETLLLEDEGSKEIAQEVMKSSRKLYTKKYKVANEDTEPKSPEKKPIIKKAPLKSRESEPLEV